MTSKLESWRRAAYNAEECLAGCLSSPEIAKHLDQATARTILERLSQARIEMLAASNVAQPAAGEQVEVIATLSVDDYFPNSGVSHPHLAFVWEISPQRQRELVKTIKEPIKLVALTAPPAAAHGDGLHFKTLEELATAIRQVSAYEDMGPELIAEEIFKQAGSAAAANGDEAVRKDAERYRWISANVTEAEVGRSSEFHTDWRRAWKLPLLLSQDAVAATFTFDEAIDAAMRAQEAGRG